MKQSVRSDGGPSEDTSFELGMAAKEEFIMGTFGPVLESIECFRHKMPETAIISRCLVIEEYVRKMLTETRDSWESYSIRVVEDYKRRVPEHQRTIDFSHSGETFRDAGNWRKSIQRFLEHGSSMRAPIELEESLVAALTQPYLNQCRRVLANRYGFVGVPLLSAGDNAHYGAFLKEIGECVSSVSEIFADQKVDLADLPNIPKAIQMIAQARTELAAMQGRLEKALQDLTKR